jgi:lysyl-tRNA synthetase class 2
MAGCDMHDSAAVARVAKEHEIETAGKHPDVLVNDVFEELVEPRLIGPVFVVDYPAALCPLTKRKRNNPSVGSGE